MYGPDGMSEWTVIQIAAIGELSFFEWNTSIRSIIKAEKQLFPFLELLFVYTIF